MESNKKIGISLCIFFSALIVSAVFSDITSSLFDSFFHPNYGFWGATWMITIPMTYEFLIVLSFTLWGIKNYYYYILAFLSPIILFILLGSIVSFNSSDVLSIIFVLSPILVAFLLAKLINFIISKFKPLKI